MSQPLEPAAVGPGPAAGPGAPAPEAVRRSGGPRRELGLAALLCLAGAALLLLGSGRHWVTLVAHEAAPLPDRRTPLTGASLVPGLPELALLGLAGVAALLATRRGGRLVVGALLLGDGVLVAVLLLPVLPDLAGRAVRSEAARGARAGTGLDTVPAARWPVLCLLGGLLLALAGGLVLARSRRWATLSARYEVPAARATAASPPGERAVWDALDRGEDPTGT